EITAQKPPYRSSAGISRPRRNIEFSLQTDRRPPGIAHATHHRTALRPMSRSSVRGRSQPSFMPTDRASVANRLVVNKAGGRMALVVAAKRHLPAGTGGPSD